MGDGHMNIFGFLQSILVGPSADIATNTVADAAEKIKTLITGELPPDKRVEAELKFIELQTAINMKEIQSTSLFIAGWRPAAAWAGVVGLVYSALVYPLFVWLSVNTGIQSPPPLDTEVLTTILYGLLGLGFYRTVEKSNGSSHKH